MKKIIFGLSIAGLLFSGYMSGTKLFRRTCAFNEPCPYFFGYPACYFGFIMFAIIAIAAGFLVFGKAQQNRALNVLLIVSLLGIAFAGFFTMPELLLLFKNGPAAYVFGLPTCALGLLFYVLIFVLSYRARFHQR